MSLEVFPGADGQLHHDGPASQASGNFVNHHLEFGALAVHLVDEAQPWHVITFRLLPDGFGLCLHASDAAEHGHRTVQNPQRPLHLDSEVHVPGRVDKVDGVVPPLERGRSRGNGYTPLLLLGEVVHDGGAVVHLADLIRPPGEIQNPLGDGRFAGIDVRHDADIAKLCDVFCHTYTAARPLPAPGYTGLPDSMAAV